MTLSPTGLSVARSLAPRGVAVYGVDCLRSEIGHYSRWVRHHARISYLRPGGRLLDGLVSFGRKQDLPPVIFLAGDPYMDFVARNHVLLREYFILPDSMRPEVCSVFLNKSTFYKRCSELGVAMPATFFPRSEREASDAAGQIGYPAIVKPAFGHLYRRRLRGRKLIEVHSPEELLQWWRRFEAWGADSVLQEVVVGPETNIHVAALYTDARLRCRSVFTARKSRQYPPWYGSGSYMEASWSEEIARLSMDLVRRLGYRGICGTEFKWDTRDGAWKLIEINPRPTLWFALTRAAGVDVVWDAYCDLVQAPNPVHVNCQNDTRRWQLLARDVVSGLYFLRRGDLGFGEFLRTVVSPARKQFAVLSRDDPRTIAAYPLYNLSKYLATRFNGSSPHVI